MHRSTDLQIWLKPLIGERRLEQSRSVRLLLRQACESNDTRLPKDFLSLPGLALIDYLRQEQQISASITHCSEMAVIALGTGLLGVDCEQSGKNRRWACIAQHFFAKAEAERIQAEADRQQEQLFLRHWVLKEACIKANSWGVFGGLNRLTLTLSDQVEITGANGNDDDRWWVWHANYGEVHLGLCNRQPLEPVPRFLWADADKTNACEDITASIGAIPLQYLKA